MVMAAILLVTVAVGGGIVAFGSGCVANAWAYLQLFPKASITTGFIDKSSTSWVNGWTVFYWAWWIAWSPFVGLFIARVSKGRTIQEYVLGVLFAPTLIAIIWLTAFGDTTLRQHAEHQTQPKTSLPSYSVALADEAGELQKDAEGHYVTEERSLTVVGYRSAKIVAEDGVSFVDSLPTVLFVLLDGLFQVEGVGDDWNRHRPRLHRALFRHVF